MHSCGARTWGPKAQAAQAEWQQGEKGRGMLSIANTGSTTAAQAQTQLVSARRDANQAERTARALEARANEAQRSADQAQVRANGLSSQADEAGQRSDTARRNLASLESNLQRGGPAFGAGSRAGVLVDTYA